MRMRTHTLLPNLPPPYVRRYLGLKRTRATGAEYDAFVGEFMDALHAWQPHIMVQFEDFGNTNAFR